MDTSVLIMLLPAFCECLVLVGIHAYLGIHVIKRQVIFVDLALAQIAALGALVAFMFGIAPQTPGSYWFSLALAAIGAAAFAVCRFRDGKIPQEAVIGLIYAVAAASSILLIDKAPHGAEQLKDILTGSILWVKWSSIGIAAAVYAGVGLLHYVFRDRFLLISENPEIATAKGLNIRFWDFLFYLTFGVVITLSVNVAGVLMVFVFLVAPAIMAISITDRVTHQLLIGWSLGLVATVLGIAASYYADLPTGPAVIACYAAVVLIVSTVLYNLRADNRIVALKRTLATALFFAAAFAVVIFIGKLVQAGS